MQVCLRVMRVLGLAAFALVLGAMQFERSEAPLYVNAPPAVDTQALGPQG